MGFSDMYGLGGGGGDHIFSEISAKVGRFQVFGLSVQNTQVANRDLSCFVHCFVISRSYKEIAGFSKSARIHLPRGIFSQPNDMFEKLRAPGKYTANLQAAGQQDLQISGRTVQVSQAVQPRHCFNKQRDLFFLDSRHSKWGGGMCTTQSGTTHGASKPVF